MATERIRFVNCSSSGGDGTTNGESGGTAAYASLSAAEAAENGDFVSADIFVTVKCSGGSGDTADTTGIVFDGSTTDATRYWNITTDDSLANSAHSGIYGTGHYRLVHSSANHTAIEIRDEHTRINGIAIEKTSTSSSERRAIRYVSQAAGATHRVSNVIIKGVVSGSGVAVGIQISDTDGQYYFKNCIAYNFVNSTTACVGFDNDSNGEVYFMNCLAQNCYDGFFGITKVRVRNCSAMDCTDGFNNVSFAFHADSNYNASDIASDAPGANSQNGSGAIFEDEGADDFHLSGSDTVCIDNGQDLSGATGWSGIWDSTDIDGDARSGTWDIGPDEYIAPATARTLTLLGVGS